MPRPSEKFEQQIKRLHELLEQPDSQITWNDHLLDPDNPSQFRQIDITIRRNDQLTLVECRIHSRPQDVTWIEELIGRKLSLRADAVIAVSASGFTDGALAKAKTFGIILRDMKSLTVDEIQQWGYRTTVRLIFYEYEAVSMIFVFSRTARGKVSVASIIDCLKGHPNEVYSIFDLLARRLDDLPDGASGRVNATAQCKLHINHQPIQKILISARFRTRNQLLETPSVVAYDEPGIDALKRNAFLEVVVGDFEISQSSNIVAVAADLSLVKTPLNCQFSRIHFDFKRVVTMRKFELLGLHKLHIPLQSLQIGLAHENEPSN